MITIDMRMLNASGIGTYMTNLIPLVISEMPDTKFTLIGDMEQLQQVLSEESDNVALKHCTAPIYSLEEQAVLLKSIPSGTRLFWSPHYNIPLLYWGKLIVTVHDVFHLTMPRYLRGVHKKMYARIMFQAVMRKAHCVLCPSKFTVGELIRVTGMRSEKVHLAYNGVDAAWFELARGISPHHRPYIVFVGNVKPHKNLNGLFRAFKSLEQAIPHDLVVVGKKEGFITADEQIMALAHQLGDRVHFTGYVDDSALRHYVAHASGLVLPSFYEGFGLPPIEAMACGCPVIVSTSGSLPEVCGDAVLYCNPYDPKDIAESVMAILSNDELRKQLIGRGKERARQFTWQNCARETIQGIRKVIPA